MDDVEVADAPERERYEARLGEVLAGFAEYIRTAELQVFTHTEVEPDFEGRGLGGALARAGLDDARARGLAVLPLCPFVKRWIEDHADYHELVYRPRPSRVTD